MAYGILKVDTITFTDGGVDKSVPVSGLVQNPTFTGNITATGTISGNIIQGGTTVSGVTVTGTTANFASGVFTTQVSGLLITGPTVSATTGTFTSLTGTTTNGTTASFTTGNFTSLTGTTTTGTTANFASGVFTTQVSGVTVIATTGTFTSLTGATTTMTSGVFASGTALLPSISFVSDPNTGIYSPGADQLAVATNGTGRLFIDASGNVNAPVSFRVGNGPTTGALSVQAAANGNLHIRDIASVTGSGTGVALDVLNDAGSTVQDLAFRGATTIFRNSASETLRITSAGLVGIGTSSPVGKLNVAGYSSTDVAQDIQITRSSSGTAIQTGPNLTLSTGTATDAIALQGTQGRFGIWNYAASNWVERFSVTGPGNVGIGSTSPQNPLVVSNGGANGFEISSATNSGTTSYLLSYNRSTSAYTDLRFDASAFRFEVSASEKARLDSSGRLLVGTTTSTSIATRESALQLSSVDFAPNVISALNIRADQYGPGIVLAKSRGGVSPGVLSGDDLGTIIFAGHDGTDLNSAGAYISAVVNGAVATDDLPTRLVFSINPGSPATGPTERMRINSAGYIKASNNGTYASSTGSLHELKGNSDDNTLRVENYQATLTGAIAGIRIVYSAASPNTTNCSFLYCDDSTALRTEIRSNGGLANYSANNANLSDRNVKKDISPAADTWDCLKEWEIVNYRYKDQPDDADLNLGVIAQQVAESCPEVITIFQEAKEATEDAPAQEERLGVKEQQMYWMAIKALQEAMERIEQLETEMAAVKAQLV